MNIAEILIIEVVELRAIEIIGIILKVEDPVLEIGERLPLVLPVLAEDPPRRVLEVEDH